MVEPPEEECIAVHEAGHAVCGFIMGGNLGWVAVGPVGAHKYTDESQDTLGSTHCDFPKPWQSGTMDASEERAAQIEFCEKNICQAYAGAIAEEILFGRWPVQGQSSDFDRIRTFIRYILELRFIPETDTASRTIDFALRHKTQQLLSKSAEKYAIRTLADVVRQRGHVEGAEASEIIRTALAERHNAKSFYVNDAI